VLTFAQKPKATQRPTSAKSKTASRAQSEQSRGVDSILSLQRTIGNQAAQRLLQAKPNKLEELSSRKEVTHFARDIGQAPQSKSLPSRHGKLVVSSPGDTYEQEANRASEQVMRMSEPQQQCTCGRGCPDCRPERPDPGYERLQRKHVQAGKTGGAAAPPIIHEVLAAPGQALAATTRRFMEPRFGHDFGDLRVHTDAKAAKSAEALGALAYTYGSHIVFAAGRYQPHTTAGRSLLAHELAHTIQQSDQTRPSEASAKGTAQNMTPGGSIPPLKKSAVVVARQPLQGGFWDFPKEVDFSKFTELYFTFRGKDTRRVKDRSFSRYPRLDDPDWSKPRGAPVTEDALAAWLAREGLDKKLARSRLLSSNEFTGSQEAREYWAKYVQDHYDDLREYQLSKENAANIEAQKRVENEQRQFNREELANFKGRTYENYLRLGEFGYFRAEYDPSKETLTISVPIDFSFLDSDVETNQMVGDPRGTKPVELVSVKETKSWSGAEIKDWQDKFIKTVETTWSSKHTIYCHRPEWEGLKASVIVKVDVMGKEIPARLEPFRAKVFRGDIPPGPCYGKGECVRKAEAMFTYKTVENGGKVAAHEFGHMLGLGDEYEEPGKPKKASHSDWVKAEFGYEVSRPPSESRLRESIMLAETGKVLPEHGVAFLEAMRRITKVEEWHLYPKKP
jgi:hypothetical protein